MGILLEPRLSNPVWQASKKTLHYTIICYLIWTDGLYYAIHHKYDTLYNTTPGLHNKIPALKIFARGWVAQETIFLHYQR